jgi:hypothetical protein
MQQHQGNSIKRIFSVLLLSLRDRLHPNQFTRELFTQLDELFFLSCSLANKVAFVHRRKCFDSEAQLFPLKDSFFRSFFEGSIGVKDFRHRGEGQTLSTNSFFSQQTQHGQGLPIRNVSYGQLG